MPILIIILLIGLVCLFLYFISHIFALIMLLVGLGISINILFTKRIIFTAKEDGLTYLEYLTKKWLNEDNKHDKIEDYTADEKTEVVTENMHALKGAIIIYMISFISLLFFAFDPNYQKGIIAWMGLLASFSMGYICIELFIENFNVSNCWSQKVKTASLLKFLLERSRHVVVSMYIIVIFLVEFGVIL